MNTPESILVDAIIANPTNKDVRKVIEGLDQEWIVSSYYKKVARACKDLLNAGMPPSLDRLMSHFQWTEQEAGELDLRDYESLKDIDLPLALEAVKREWLKRSIQSITLQASDLDTDDPMSVGQAVVANISNLMIKADSSRLKVKNLRESMDKLQMGQPLLPPELSMNKCWMNIQGIDDVVRMGAGRLGVIAALTSAGKTSLGIQALQVTATRGGRGLLVSLEMDDAEVDSKRLACWTGRDAWKIMRNDKQMWFNERHLSAAERCLNITCGAGQDWFALDAKIRAIHTSTPLDLIIIDYFTLLEPPVKHRGENSAASYGHISKGAKMLAKELQCCVILVAQFNRTADEYTEPLLKQLKETSQLEQDADFALLLWNLKDQAPNQNDRVVACRIAKNRGGRRGDLVHLVFSPHNNRFVQAQTKALAA